MTHISLNETVEAQGNFLWTLALAKIEDVLVFKQMTAIVIIDYR